MMEYYSAIKTNEILACATWINLKKLCKVKEPKHKNINVIWFHLHEIPFTGKFRETKSRLKVTRG
jgi:hypothetical protein